MKRILILTAAVLVLGASMVLWQRPATAETTQVAATLTETTFYIDNMTCALCPVTVKAAMSAVQGVSDVEIDFPARTARVTFDPALTNAKVIGDASEAAGYPAQPKS